MDILGLSFGSHDAAAALVRDGQVVAAAEEERFNRQKHTKRFPENAIFFCLEKEGINLLDVKHVAFYVKPHLHLWMPFVNLANSDIRAIKYFPKALQLYRERMADLHLIQKTFPAARIYLVNHHLTHAASCYYLSGFNDAAIVTVDGRGEYLTTAIFKGAAGRITMLDSVPYPHSLGFFYSAITDFLGFRPQHDEYKVMGLSAYGTDRLLPLFEDMVACRDGSFRLNLSYFDHQYAYGRQRKKLTRKFMCHFPGTLSFQDKADIAYGVQRVMERALLRIFSQAVKRTNTYCLCYAGGVALNCVANRLIADQDFCGSIFVTPAANDAGASMGAALYTYHVSRPEIGTTVKNRNFVYLGNEFSNTDIESFMERYCDRFVFRKINDACQTAAELLAKDYIIAWVQGRMEFGPRALGNRSFLANPKNLRNRQTLNRMIKQREDFRPFACSILEECTEQLFNYRRQYKLLAKYMLLTMNVRPGRETFIEAAIHVDGTSRVQTVSCEDNPRYYQLILNFYRLTNIPAVLNTSYNIEGPISCSPDDILSTFSRSGLDFLFWEDYLVSPRNKNHRATYRIHSKNNTQIDIGIDSSERLNKEKGSGK